MNSMLATIKNRFDREDEGFTWYRGPSGWHLQYLPDSLRNLTTNLTGALFAR